MQSPCGGREHLPHFEALEEGTGRAVGQITDGSGELVKSQSMQGPENQFQEMCLCATKAKETLGGVFQF